MLFDDTYKTISEQGQGSYRDRASRFISFAVPVVSEQEVKDALDSLRKKYHDANHHCYAYCLGADKSGTRTNDDGEPSGSAGKPIFGQIRAMDLTNILVVVVRYFGGTKLGIPGLINAYKTAARDAIENTKIIERTVDEEYDVEFPYPAMNDVMKILKEEGASVRTRETEQNCRIRFTIRKNAGFRAFTRLQKIPKAKVTVRGSS